MKLLVDNNLSYKLVFSLNSYFPGSTHIREVLSVLADDGSIWHYAKERDFAILTKDNDFDEQSQVYGCPPKVIHLICGNRSTTYILDLLVRNKDIIISFLQADKENCILKIS